MCQQLFSPLSSVFICIHTYKHTNSLFVFTVKLNEYFVKLTHRDESFFILLLDLYIMYMQQQQK